jgi:hypothetical protein
MEQKIKCHLCNGEAILKYEKLELNEGRIVINDSPYYHCNKCNEDFSTSEQMIELDKQLHTQFSFKRNLTTSGRSISLNLPSDLANNYKLKKGKEIELIPQNSKQILLQIK